MHVKKNDTIEFYYFVLSTYPIGSLIISACLRIFVHFVISIYLQCSISFKNSKWNGKFVLRNWITGSPNFQRKRNSVALLRYQLFEFKYMNGVLRNTDYHFILQRIQRRWRRQWRWYSIIIHTYNIHVSASTGQRWVFITQTRVCKPHHTQNVRRKRNETK